MSAPESKREQSVHRRPVLELIKRYRRAAWLLKSSAVLILLATMGIVGGGAWFFVEAGAIAEEQADFSTRLVASSIDQLEQLTTSIFRKDRDDALEKLQKAAGSGPESAKVVEDFRAVTELHKQIATDMRKSMETTLSKAMSEQTSAQVWQAVITTSVARLTAAGLVFFLVQLFITLYRYNFRLGAYYGARADALSLSPDAQIDELQRLVVLLSPDVMDFGELPKPPSEQVLQFARDALSTAKNVAVRP